MKYNHLTTRLSFSTLLIGGTVMIVAILMTRNMRDILFGAPLAVSTAPNGTTLSEGLLPISGKARHARELRINGRNVLIDRDGNFSEAVLLSPGYNIVSIVLKDQFGKEKTAQYHLVLDQSNTVVTKVEAVPHY